MNQMLDMARRISALEAAMRRSKAPRLGNSTIDGGALRVEDGFGNLTMIIGRQYDGSNTAAPVASSPPPQPTAPAIEAAMGGIRVSWDGQYEEAMVSPMDFSKVSVHVAPAGTEPSPFNRDSIVGWITSPMGGQVSVLLDDSAPVDAWLVSWNASGKPSQPSVGTQGQRRAVEPADLSPEVWQAITDLVADSLSSGD